MPADFAFYEAELPSYGWTVERYRALADDEKKNVGNWIRLQEHDRIEDEKEHGGPRFNPFSVKVKP